MEIKITDGEPNGKGVKDVNDIILNVEKENTLNDKYNSFLKDLVLNNNGFYKRIKQFSADIKCNKYFDILSKPIACNANIKYNNKCIKCLITNDKFYTLYHGNDIIICGKINKKNGSHLKHMNIEMNIIAISATKSKPIEIVKILKQTVIYSKLMKILNEFGHSHNQNNFKKIH